ncbi:MAG: hypothetical protein JWO05_1549 [Gemmatimonadetes bacterium]|nr:hypothetical protein [Gemmatimonadota bacterium]
MRKREQSRYHHLTDGELVEQMRALDEGAWQEFLDRFRPAMRLAARHLGIPLGDRDEMVNEMLDDAALEFARPARLLPASMSGYLVRTLRNRWHKRLRSEGRRDARDQQCVSEPLAEYGATSALRKLVMLLESIVTPGEAELLAHVAAASSMREAAEWCGKSFDAAEKAIYRARRKLKRAAPGIVLEFTGEERREIERFFRRVGVDLTGTDDASPTGGTR